VGQKWYVLQHHATLESMSETEMEGEWEVGVGGEGEGEAGGVSLTLPVFFRWQHV